MTLVEALPRIEGLPSHTLWSIEDVLRHFGWDGHGRAGGRGVAIRCPIHGERHPSGVVYSHLNAYRCYACDARGNSVTLVMQQLGLDASGACDWLSANIVKLNGPSSFTQDYEHEAISSVWS